MQKVCEDLLRRGPLTLEQLIRFTELTKEQVKTSLLVLVQHNCVQAFILEVEEGVLLLLFFFNTLKELLLVAIFCLQLRINSHTFIRISFK